MLLLKFKFGEQTKTMSDFNTESMNTLMEAEIANKTASTQKVETTVTQTPEEIAAAQAAADIATQQQSASTETKDTLADFLKEHNVASIDELKEVVSKSTKKEESKEEKEQKEKERIASIDKYAQEKNILSREEIVKLESLKTADKQEILFKQFEEKNKEKYAKKFDGEEDAQLLASNALKEAFERKYHINSLDEEDKEFGASKLEDDFTKLVTPLQSKYEKAQTEYDSLDKAHKAAPVFNSYIEKTINASIKDSEKVFEKDIDGEKISVEAKLTKEEKQQVYDTVLKEYAGDMALFVDFMDNTKDGKNDRIEKAIQQRVDLERYKLTQSKVHEDIFEKAFTKGKSKGSNNGSEVPFALNKKQNNAAGGGSNENAVSEMLESIKRLN